MTAPHEWVLAHAQRTPDAPAVAGPDHRTTYAQLAGRILGFASMLRGAGLRQGDRVVVALPQGGAAVVAALGVQAAGGCSCELSPRLPLPALQSAVRRVGARFAVVHRRDAAQLATCFGPLDVLVLVGESEVATGPAAATTLFLPEDGSCEAASDPPVAAEPGSPALVLFTSGSTGDPRGVVLSHGNLETNAVSIARYLELTERDRACLVLPLGYSYGRSVLHSHLLVGGSVFLDGRFMYPRLVLDTAAAEGCTGFSGVPATYEALRRALAAPVNVPSLRQVTQAGGAMRRETVLWCQSAFHPARVHLMYGQTEATARLSHLPPDRIDDKAGSIGNPIPGVTLEVVGPDGKPVPDGTVGELCARGGNVAMGYLDDPVATAATFRSGRLHTGDLGYRDGDGFFFLTGRASEILKIAGYRVSPATIEEVLATHPDVLEVAISGATDPALGEVAVAFVVPRNEKPPAEELMRFCRKHLAAHMVPRRIAFLGALPRNEAGKLLRRELAAPATDDQEAVVPTSFVLS